MVYYVNRYVDPNWVDMAGLEKNLKDNPLSVHGMEGMRLFADDQKLGKQLLPCIWDHNWEYNRR